MDLFINTGFNYMSIRSHLVSQSKNKLISSDEQLVNIMNLLYTSFGVILPQNPQDKDSITSQINPVNYR